MQDPYDLQRFILAQEPVFTEVLSELSSGKKRSHWMWFIFPQIAGLGQSPTAVRYSISGKAEAEAFLEHPLLGQRLVACAQKMLEIDSQSADEVLGVIDAMKLRSSMTLFSNVSDKAIFSDVLEKYYRGQCDLATLNLLGIEGESI